MEIVFKLIVSDFLGRLKTLKHRGCWGLKQSRARAQKPSAPQNKENSFSTEKFSILEEKQYKQVLQTHKTRDIKIWTINVTGICKLSYVVKLPDEQAKDKDVIFLKNRFLRGKNSNQNTA